MLPPILATLFFVSFVDDAAAKREAPSVALLDKLTWEMTSWKSLEVVMKEDLRFHEGFNKKGYDASFYNSVETHFILTQDGKKMIDAKSTTDGGKIHRVQGFDDGGVCARVDFDDVSGLRQKTVGFSKLFLSEGRPEAGPSKFPAQYKYMYLNGVPLYKTLKSEIYSGHGSVLGYDCGIFSMKEVRIAKVPLDVSCFLEVRSGILLKVVAEMGHGEGRFVAFDWEALSVGKFQGRRHVDRSRFTAYNTGGSPDRPVKLYTATYEITRINYDKKYNDSDFRPVLQPGSQVIDKVRHKAYTVGEDGREMDLFPGRKAASSPAKDGKKTSSPSPRTRDHSLLPEDNQGARRSSWFWFVAGGFAVLLAAFLLWLRQR